MHPLAPTHMIQQSAHLQQRQRQQRKRQRQRQQQQQHPQQ